MLVLLELLQLSVVAVPLHLVLLHLQGGLLQLLPTLLELVAVVVPLKLVARLLVKLPLLLENFFLKAVYFDLVRFIFKLFLDFGFEKISLILQTAALTSSKRIAVYLEF